MPTSESSKSCRNLGVQNCISFASSRDGMTARRLGFYPSCALALGKSQNIVAAPRQALASLRRKSDPQTSWARSLASANSTDLCRPIGACHQVYGTQYNYGTGPSYILRAAVCRRYEGLNQRA